MYNCDIIHMGKYGVNGLAEKVLRPYTRQYWLKRRRYRSGGERIFDIIILVLFTTKMKNKLYKILFRSLCLNKIIV